MDGSWGAALPLVFTQSELQAGQQGGGADGPNEPTNSALKVLNMRRLQALDQFTLVDFGDWMKMDSGISGQEFMHFLQTSPLTSEALVDIFFQP